MAQSLQASTLHFVTGKLDFKETSQCTSKGRSVTTSPISMKTCRKGHRWCKHGDAALSFSLFIRIQKSSSLTGAKHGCFSSLENARFGGAFYAVFRDDFADLHENLQKRSSLVQEWRRRFEFLAFHLHSKKF